MVLLVCRQKKIICFLSANKKISSLVTSIIEETEEEGILSIALSNIHLVELMLHIIKLTHPDLSLITDICAQTPEHIRYVSYALSYIHENFSKKILIPDIASHLNISSRYLSKIFFHHMNLTILNYINIYRINHAIELMLNTNLTLTNIAEYPSTCIFHKNLNNGMINSNCINNILFHEK